MSTTAAKAQHEVHHPSELNLYNNNPRRGDVDAIAASLRANNQYKPITVNRGTHTHRPMEVLAGNHTLKAFRDLAEKYPDDERWQRVDTWIIDVDNDRATRIILADNRTAEVGTFDDETLFELLGELPDLEGTGYNETDLQALQDLTGGAPSLDELEDEVGTPTEEDSYVVVRLSVAAEVGKEWDEYRKTCDSDTEALRNLLPGTNDL